MHISWLRIVCKTAFSNNLRHFLCETLEREEWYNCECSFSHKKKIKIKTINDKAKIDDENIENQLRVKKCYHEMF